MPGKKKKKKKWQHAAMEGRAQAVMVHWFWGGMILLQILACKY